MTMSISKSIDAADPESAGVVIDAAGPESAGVVIDAAGPESAGPASTATAGTAAGPEPVRNAASAPAGPAANLDDGSYLDAHGFKRLPVPPKNAPWSAKMAYYRSQHQSKGVRLAHLFGIPGVAFSMPIIVVKPIVGVPLFVASWTVQVGSHIIFEKNKPALSDGFFTYQFAGLAFWCEEMGNLVAGRGIITDE